MGERSYGDAVFCHSLNLRGHRKTTASLDRIDSRKGYTIDNVHWVLKAVNIMKNTYPLSFFVAICRKVVAKCSDVATLENDEILQLKWNNNVGLNND